MTRVIFEGNTQDALQMKKYMRNQFDFAGLKSPARKVQEVAVLKESKEWELSELLLEIAFYYSQTKREYQYLAIDLALKNVKRIDAEAMRQLEKYNVEKAWWDSVDAWCKVYRLWFLAHPEAQNKLFAYFASSDNFWNRRIAITLQLQFKGQTNEMLLTQAIEQDLTTDEFFIQKAIGWALRDYAKTNSQFVVNFISEHTLSNLAKREAEKHL